MEEGIHFEFLTNPIEIIGDDRGRVKAIKCEKMKLEGQDSSGRPRPVRLEDSEFDLAVDLVIMALGTNPNPLIANTTNKLEVDNKNRIITVNEKGKTSKEGVLQEEIALQVQLL